MKNSNLTIAIKCIGFVKFLSINYQLVVVVLLPFLLLNNAHAQNAKSQPSSVATVKTNVPNSVKSDNKIYIEADKVEIIDISKSTPSATLPSSNATVPKKMVLTGAVNIKHQDATINAEQITINEISPLERDIVAVGKDKTPVSILQKTKDVNTGEEINNRGHAQKILYNSKTRVTTLIGDAFLEQNKNQVNAEKITYNLDSGYYVAEKENNPQRVKIVIEDKKN